MDDFCEGLVPPAWLLNDELNEWLENCPDMDRFRAYARQLMWLNGTQQCDRCDEDFKRAELRKFSGNVFCTVCAEDEDEVGEPIAEDTPEERRKNTGECGVIFGCDDSVIGSFRGLDLDTGKVYSILEAWPTSKDTGNITREETRSNVHDAPITMIYRIMLDDVYVSVDAFKKAKREKKEEEEKAESPDIDDVSVRSQTDAVSTESEEEAEEKPSKRFKQAVPESVS